MSTVLATKAYVPAGSRMAPADSVTRANSTAAGIALDPPMMLKNVPLCAGTSECSRSTMKIESSFSPINWTAEVVKATRRLEIFKVRPGGC